MSIWVKTFEKLGHWLSKILRAMGWVMMAQLSKHVAGGGN
jgi:hypothetical protein